VSSVVNSAFHSAVVAGLPKGSEQLMRDQIGGGPEERELQRALMLADRAARDWLGAGIAVIRPGAPNRLEELSQLGKPEDGYFELEPAGRAERKASTGTDDRQLAVLAEELGRDLADLDTEATVAVNKEALEAVAEKAAESLLEAADQLGGDDFVIEKANEMLADLIALRGWENQLGSRFDV
jgi:hypothetical protein